MTHFRPPTGAAESPRARDLSWQAGMQRVWEQQAAPNASRLVPVPPLPPVPQLAESLGGAAQDSSRGAVLPSLQGAIDWLRRAARERPAVRMQVLVTGSLYLVGDTLRLLGKTIP